MNVEEFVAFLNKCGENRTPFFFLTDFELKKPFACPLEDTHKQDIFYHIKHFKNFQPSGKRINISLKIHPVPFSRYKQAFDTMKKHINAGNTYLINLTFPTEIETNATLMQIFLQSQAPFKLYFKGKVIVFSPESFITIHNNLIKTYPMKGTIDASIPEAKKKLLKDEKELAEHYTVVDLLRNDLSIISSQVTVTRFMYISQIKTNRKTLLQASSEITGKLNANWRSRIGEILIKLLPAGSISGAPKKKTLEIIKEAEKKDRGYFTGVFGVFDGVCLTSAVCIRFIEKIGDKLFFRSGGGITFMSDPVKEYKELIDKVYVPIV